jgi:hypothetical protein
MTATSESVGPVLTAGNVAQAAIAAIRARHGDLCVIDRGSYWRVLVPGRCVLDRREFERILGTAIRFPSDLEAIMPSFKGRLRLSSDEAIWAAEVP